MRKPAYHASIRVVYLDIYFHRKIDLPLVDRDFASYADYCLVRDSIEDYCTSVGIRDFNIHSSVIPYDYYRKEVAMAKMRYAQSRGVSRRQFKRTAVKTPAVNVAPPKRGGIRL